MSSLAPLRSDLARNPILLSMIQYDKHVRFVEDLLGRSAPQIQWTHWIKGMQPLTEYPHAYMHWARTLKQLEENLGNYDVQNASYCLPEFRNESSRSFEVTGERVRNFITDDREDSPVPKPIYVRLANFLQAFSVLSWR